MLNKVAQAQHGEVRKITLLHAPAAALVSVEPLKQYREGDGGPLGHDRGWLRSGDGGARATALDRLNRIGRVAL